MDIFHLDRILPGCPIWDNHVMQAGDKQKEQKLRRGMARGEPILRYFFHGIRLAEFVPDVAASTSGIESSRRIVQ
jgi:hypothetical protein